MARILSWLFFSHWRNPTDHPLSGKRNAHLFLIIARLILYCQVYWKLINMIIYSYLRASIGSIFAADLAGKTPKNIPIIAETLNPSAIAYGGTEYVQAR
jgi:hypothetical protein